MSEEKNNSAASDNHEREAIKLLGIFLGIFGLTVIVAVAFTETFQGKVANLVSGSIFILASFFAFLKGRYDKNKSKKENN